MLIIMQTFKAYKLKTKIFILLKNLNFRKIQKTTFLFYNIESKNIILFINFVQNFLF